MTELLEGNKLRLANVSVSAAKRFGSVGVEAIFLIQKGMSRVTYVPSDPADESASAPPVDATTEMIRRHSGGAMLRDLGAHD